jgi:hypothetical protein
MPIMVDEDNQEALKKILRIGIGAEMAMNGSVAEIKEFFSHTKKEMYMDELNQKLKEKREEEQEEFNTETLTEEQKEKLMLFTRMNNKDLN